MISIRLEGRLGNQFFQHAFIYAAAKKLKTNYYIDQYIERSVVDKYFVRTANSPANITRLFNISGYKNFFSFYLRRIYYNCLTKLYGLSVKQYSFTEVPCKIKVADNTIYQGYFQSDVFFKPYESIIRDNFIIRPEFIKTFNLRYGSLYKNNTIITVHIRRTDYKSLSHLNLGRDDLSLPVSYYLKAITNYDGQNVHFIFISDDVQFVEENFNCINNKTISTDNEIMDLQHLINADGCIISNSTFSWWGAWLNIKKNKVIHAPKYFMGWPIKQEVPDTIYPNDWIQIEV